jgi:DHA2 family multidrug resistance protein-like MFS transporter
VFLLAVPVMVVLLTLGPRILPEYKDPNAKRLDLASVVMSLVAVLAIIFGLKQIAQDGVGALPVATVLLGLVVGGVWMRRQLTADDPMFDLSLFRIPRFTAALAVNFLTIFVAIGYFLFVAQYLQLVLGLSPLEAGLWSIPEALGFVVGSNVTPRIVRRIRPAHLMGAGLGLAALGLLILSQITLATENALVIVVGASVIISLGLAPIFGLTTELIVGSAPPERAGAATGMSETASELGGALGLSILGTIGVAIYRAGVNAGMPAGVPEDVATTARDTLGGAAEVASRLPPEIGTALLVAAQDAFVDGMQVVFIVSLVLSALLAAVAVVGLHHVGPTSSESLGADAGHAPGPGAEERRPAGTTPTPVAET